MRAIRLLLCCLVLLAVTACAKPKNVVLLLPDPDGHVGTVTVANERGAQTLTQAGTATRIESGKTAPETPAALSAEEQEKLFGEALRALPSQPVRFILYFTSDGVQLTPESQALLPKVLTTVQERKSQDIAVVGHASAVGDEKYNLELSRRRATLVRDLLIKVGVPREAFEVTSHGSRNPLVISSNPNEPRNRRVEVTVR